MRAATIHNSMARTTAVRRAVNPDSALAGHLLSRSHSPRRKNTVPSRTFEMQRRQLFGLSEIMGVITNPAETVRSLTESRRLLEEARMEIAEARERAQLRPAHTFSRLPGFFERPAELRAIQLILEGDPSFTVLFGASSVGKTALLREVLSMPKYHVLHFDLRIAGFNDLGAMYASLSSQMEQYYLEIAKLDGYKDFEKEAWSFKHDRLNVERRISESPPDSNSQVKTSDIARLMELFQSSLLKYWEFRPDENEEATDDAAESEGVVNKSSRPGTATSRRADTPNGRESDADLAQGGKAKGKWPSRLLHRKSRMDMEEPRDGPSPRPSEAEIEEEKKEEESRRTQELERIRAKKRVPVIFFDEAHKLPALIKSTEAMKCILDSMLVLTKQDRLCHVVHATSDPFYQTWLRQLNIMQHCKIITIGDCSREEARVFFQNNMLPRVPDKLQPGLDFDHLYEAFGGKLAHWSDFVTDYVNANGRLTIERSTHFLQAHALLNLHLLHSSNLTTPEDPESTVSSGAGFRIYSPLSNPRPHTAPTSTADEGAVPAWTADFSASQLLRVMGRLARGNSGSQGLSYFALCREIGVSAVDGMVKGRILELRWTDTITAEGSVSPAPPPTASPASEYTVDARFSGATADWVPMTPMSGRTTGYPATLVPDEPEFVGPRLVPTTPIMRYAMRAVFAEYEDISAPEQVVTRSETESATSGPDEY